MNAKVRKQIDNLLSEVGWLKWEFDDLGWDMDGCPEGDKCEEFTKLILRMQARATWIGHQINNPEDNSKSPAPKGPVKRAPKKGVKAPPKQP